MIVTEAPSVSEFFAADHDRLDGFFAEFRRLKRIDFPKAKENFKQFMFGLKRHIIWEEEFLFPAFERGTGFPGAGPTAVMRVEHRRIGDWLEAIHDKVRRADPESDREEAALLDVLAQHNAKEENVLYPMLDRSLSNDERETMFDAMARLPADAYATCCGGRHHT
jgi:iron-sulfur cluster repair protein YtfE (RIC family)